MHPFTQKITQRLKTREALLRFFIVNVFGVLTDLAIALFFHRYMGVNLFASSAISVFIISCIMYILNEKWTFQEAEKKLSINRAVKFFLLVLIVVLVRQLCLLTLSFMPLTFDNIELFKLIVATGVSFSVNYIISKKVIFIKS